MLSTKIHQGIYPLMGTWLTLENAVVLNLSPERPFLNPSHLEDEKHFSEAINTLQNNKPFAYGGYLEKRWFYQRGKQFVNSQEARNIHLGIDIWADANTPVYAPINCKVHSFKNNALFSDYGPTIILELAQAIKGANFMLLGHLALKNLRGLHVGKSYIQGDVVAHLGEYGENGAWPPHVHVQLIKDLEGCEGDYFGVCHEQEQDTYAANCPSPLELIKVVGV